MEDSALLLALVLAVVALMLVAASFVSRSAQRRAAGEPRPTGREIHRDPDPERVAGGRADSHPH